ncbi:uncharacterized protein LOC115034968 [Acyrthosiphon pisum]|uniref:CCHC-type domain-containing protein n=1 Tax=Acyrthosiphon pisum TaxID=7029 RepID=A0A8R2NUD4_ACYPI|nr:uncharacterized protein LOC115034968 [Acyrthosiphon pisum]
MDSSSEPCADSGKSTLAEKLIASQAATSGAAAGSSEDGGNSTASPYAMVKILGGRIQYLNGVLSQLFTKAQGLEASLDKLRSDPAKVAIHETLSVIRVLRGCKEEIAKAYNAAAIRIKEVDVNTALEHPRKLNSDAETQSPCWWDTMPQTNIGVGSSGGGPEKWTEVVKKRQAKKQVPSTEGAPAQSAKPDTKKESTRPRVRSRPQAILVGVKAEEFPALAKKIRGGVDHGVIGDSVVGMRQAKSGGLLIEVRGDQDKLEAVRAEISRSAGTEFEVRALQQKVLIEVRDLDQWTTADEVMEAMATATGSPPESLKVVSLRKRYEGTQMALVSLPIGSSRGVLSTGRLRVGMVSCRLRMAEGKPRCFRCFTHGHMARECNGPDRSGCCRRCGETGHKAVSCGAAEQAVSAFARVVQGSKSMPSAGSYRSGGATEDQSTPK